MLLKDILLSEGLIKSHSYSYIIRILKNYNIDYNLDTDRFLKIGGVRIHIKSKDIQIIIKLLENVINKLGWYFAYFINYKGESSNNYKDFLTFIKNYQEYDPDDELGAIFLEPKYGTKTTPMTSILYHVTDIKYLPKILKYGLVPKSKSKVTYHPERIYFLKSIEDVEDLVQDSRFGVENPVLLKIGTGNLSNKFYLDPNLNGAIYTTTNISPKNIISYDEYIPNQGDNLLESSTHKDYLKWKRKNVTLRGVNNGINNPNGGSSSLGKGLYTAVLSYKQLARQYGEVYFVVNAIPKNPKIFSSYNEFEIFLQNLIMKLGYTRYEGQWPDEARFYKETSIEKEIMKLGYDGIILKGREMVNYTPEDIRYFKDERDLQNYYYNVIANNKLNETVLNEEHKKLILFHGTSKIFDKFKPGIAFFTDQARFAYDYANTKNFDNQDDSDIKIIKCEFEGNLFEINNKNELLKLYKALPDEIEVSDYTGIFSKKIAKKNIINSLLGYYIDYPDDKLKTLNVGDTYKYDGDNCYVVNKTNLDISLINSDYIRDITDYMFGIGNYRPNYVTKYIYLYDDFINKGREIIKQKTQKNYVSDRDVFDTYQTNYIYKELSDEEFNLLTQILKDTNKKVLIELAKDPDRVRKISLKPKKIKLRSNWNYFENQTIINAIKNLGFDGYRAVEDNTNTYAIFDPNKTIKILDNLITEDYQGEHEAPDKESGYPLYDVSGVYPDIKTNGNDYIFDTYDRECLSIILSIQGKPNALVKVYRAVPDINKDVKTQISKLYNLIHYKSQYGFFPLRKVNPLISKYEDKYSTEENGYIYDYDETNQRIENDIKNDIKILVDKLQKPIKINPGDWVSLSLGYAKEHGVNNLRNKYKIISKTVKAKNLFTDGNSLSEVGYDI